MRCREVTEKLSAYAAGDLPSDEQQTVEAHLRGCRQCRRDAEAAARSEEALAMLGAVETAPDLSRDLRRRIAKGENRGRPWAWIGTAAVAVILLAFLVSLLVIRPRDAALPNAPRPAVVANVPPEVGAAGATAETMTPPSQCPEDDQEPEVQPTLDGPGIRQRPVAVAAHPAPLQTAVDSPTSWGTGEEPAPPSTPEATEPTELRRADEVRSLLLRDAVRRRALAKSGIVFLVGTPAEEPQAKAYYVEITLPDGTQSVVEHGSIRDVAGETNLLPAVLQ
jgi:hypothetical protein